MDIPKLLIDSSVFISSLGISDEYSSISKKFFREIITHEIVVPTLVICEVVAVLKKQNSM